MNYYMYLIFEQNSKAFKINKTNNAYRGREE